jgi:hypothetical protein
MIVTASILPSSGVTPTPQMEKQQPTDASPSLSRSVIVGKEKMTSKWITINNDYLQSSTKLTMTE